MEDIAIETLDAGLRKVMAHRLAGTIKDPLPLLVQGDATRPATLTAEIADLIITSPPYNVGMPYNGNGCDDAISPEAYAKFSMRWLKNCYRWTRPTGRLCVNVSIDKNKHGKMPLAANITAWALASGWKYHATILWNEGNISRRTAWGSWKSASAPHIIAPVEVVVVLYKGDWKRENPGKSDITGDEFKDWVLGIWNFNGENAKRIGHDAPFPRALPLRCIKLFSFLGDTVLDPFSGSGTTMIEAMNNGRRAVGIEMEPKYCELSLRRIEKECGVKLRKSPPLKAGRSIAPYWTL